MKTGEKLLPALTSARISVAESLSFTASETPGAHRGARRLMLRIPNRIRSRITERPPPLHLFAPVPYTRGGSSVSGPAPEHF